MILSIPTNGLKRDGYSFWCLDNMDAFSVKSVYQLGLRLDSIGERSSSSVEGVVALWNYLWWCHIPSKVKNCCWRTLKDIIPIRGNLMRKGVDLDPFCPLCGRKPETSTHLFWWFKEVGEVWSLLFNSDIVSILCNRDFGSALDRLTWCYGRFGPYTTRWCFVVMVSQLLYLQIPFKALLESLKELGVRWWMWLDFNGRSH